MVIMAVMAILDIATVYQSFRNHSKVNSLAPVTKTKVVETVTSLLIRLGGVRDSFLHTVPSHDSCSR